MLDTDWVEVTIDPGDGNGFAAGNEEEGDSTCTECVHQVEKYYSTLKHSQKQWKYGTVEYMHVFLSAHLRHERQPQ